VGWKTNASAQVNEARRFVPNFVLKDAGELFLEWLKVLFLALVFMLKHEL
jgi:hypothetical protein